MSPYLSFLANNSNCESEIIAHKFKEGHYGNQILN